ncbi:hypothetical protein C9374_012531 [Naegleria lovaniensis]|uniref:Uncharacterized protein n=1 Tax=Naegleria lovaniensis TaxID=51637 RepID=A0AA88GXB9_NAELO|nr:uncharacterized protein C9374_012531 [Naegleria lovaniensis]KAG2392279.1 hypothetical protein C9374_012531 [Naegleria lovaniensis]
MSIATPSAPSLGENVPSSLSNNSNSTTFDSVQQQLSTPESIIGYFSSKIAVLNLPSSSSTNEIDMINTSYNKITREELEKNFSDIASKVLANDQVAFLVNSFLVDLFLHEKTSSDSENQMYQNYLRVAYHVFLLNTKTDSKNSNLDLVLLQHVPVCLYIYLETKNVSKLSEIQLVFLSKIESILLLIFNTENIKRREMPEKEKTLSFLASSIEGVKTKYNNGEKLLSLTSSSSSKELQSSYNSLILGSSHANEDFFTGVAHRQLYLRNEMATNNESLSPLYFRDYETYSPLLNEISERVLSVVCQVFANRLEVLPKSSIFTFLRVFYQLVSQQVPYRIPTLEQVSIIKDRNAQAKNIMEESLKVIKEDITGHSHNEPTTTISNGKSEKTDVISELDIQVDVENSNSQKAKKKKLYYHEYLTQLDLITLYSEHYGDYLVESPTNTFTAGTIGSHRIFLQESFINDAVAILKYCSLNMEKFTAVTLFKDVFADSSNNTVKDVRPIIIETLYAVYLRLVYDFIDSKSLIQIQAILKLLD